MCRGGHVNQDCEAIKAMARPIEHGDYSGNTPHQNNPHINTYNLGWRDHLNFSWGNQEQNGQYPSLGFQQQPSPQEKNFNLEDLMAKFI